MTTIGQLRDRIKIQKQSGSDDWGNPLPDGSWADHATVWAHVLHQNGAQAIKADADTSIVRASMRIRWRTDITAAMRVIFMGVAYEIDAVLPGQKRDFVDLACKRVSDVQV